MKIINLDILYLDESDIQHHTLRHKKFEDLSIYNLKDKSIILRQNVVILYINGKSKLLKSRY